MAGSNGVAALCRALRLATSSFERAGDDGARMAETWWDLDREILAAMGDRPVSPATLARRLGLPESAMTSMLCLLVSEGKIRISAVQRVESAHE